MRMKHSVELLAVALSLIAVFSAGCPIQVEKNSESDTGNLSSAKEITAFSIVNPSAVGIISSTSRTIDVTVPAATDRISLVAAFKTTGVSVRVGNVPQISGVTQNNFTNPVVYTVFAEDGSTAQYTVTVSLSGSSSAKAITNFSILGRPGNIDEVAKTITVLAPYGANFSSMIATFTTTGASVKVAGVLQTSGTTVNDFTAPVTYTVTAADGTSVNYVVSVPYPVLYVSNSNDNTVSVINGLNGNGITVINVGNGPAGVGVNPVTKKIYIANSNDYSVSVINGATNIIQTTINLAGSDPQMVGVNPATGKIYVAYTYYNDYVEIIDGGTDTVLTHYETSGNYPVGIGVNKNTEKVYIVLWGDSSVDVINAVTNAFITNINLVNSEEKGGVAVNPVTNKIYVPDVSVSGAVTVINGTTDTVTGSVAVGNSPISAAVNTATNRIYVTNKGDGSVSVINGATNTVITTVAVGSGPLGIALSERHNLIYVVNENANTLSVIDGATNTVIDTITVGTGPTFIGLLE